MSKPNLPPLPQMDVGVSGQVKFAYSQEALTAYAEEAVRQALEHAATVAERYSFAQNAAKAIHSLAQERASGHKPAPVNTSSGHSIPEARDG